MSHLKELSATTRRTVSRRTVVRTAAHSAWLVPAVTMVTSAPALAASAPGKPSLTVTNGSGTWGTVSHSGNTYTYTNWAVSGIVVGNPSTNPATDTATGITVTISFATSTFKPSSLLTPTVTGTGWSFSASSSTATSYVFNYTGTVAPGGSTPALGATFPFSASFSNPGNKPSGETASSSAAATVFGSSTAFNTASGSITSTN